MKYLLPVEKLQSMIAWIFFAGYDLGKQSMLPEEDVTAEREKILEQAFEMFTYGSDAYFAKHLPLEVEGNDGTTSDY